jgi:hypothetical protein
VVVGVVVGVVAVVVLVMVDGVGSSSRFVNRTTTAAVAANTTTTPAARMANWRRYQGNGAACSESGSSGPEKAS